MIKVNSAGNLLIISICTIPQDAMLPCCLIRDSEISAKTLGINNARYKIIAFAISSFYAGIAGSLYAYFFTFIGPDIFSRQFPEIQSQPLGLFL